MNRRTTENEKISPEELLCKSPEGKESVFVFLFRKYYTPLYNYAGRLLHDKHLAKEENNIKLLWKAIDTLPERCRQIFFLRKIEGWSSQEIATHLEISVKTVEAQIIIAFGKIRKYFKELNIKILYLFFSRKKRLFI